MADITVRNNPQENRFEVSVDGEFAGVMDYRIDDGQVLLPRVEVLPKFRGGGVASTLVQQGMDTIREEGWGGVGSRSAPTWKLGYGAIRTIRISSPRRPHHKHDNGPNVGPCASPVSVPASPGPCRALRRPR